MAKFVSFADSRDVGQKKDVLEIIILPYIPILILPYRGVPSQARGLCEIHLGGLSGQGGRVLESNEGASLIGIQA